MINKKTKSLRLPLVTTTKEIVHNECVISEKIFDKRTTKKEKYIEINPKTMNKRWVDCESEIQFLENRMNALQLILNLCVEYIECDNFSICVLFQKEINIIEQKIKELQ